VRGFCFWSLGFGASIPYNSVSNLGPRLTGADWAVLAFGGSFQGVQT
jgi:hypothetical protein